MFSVFSAVIISELLVSLGYATLFRINFGTQFYLLIKFYSIHIFTGKQEIRDLAGMLNLNRHCVDTAFNFFKMAISKRLSRGRRIKHIVAACVYMTCRTEATPRILLIALVDVLSSGFPPGLRTPGRCEIQHEKNATLNKFFSRFLFHSFYFKVCLQFDFLLFIQNILF